MGVYMRKMVRLLFYLICYDLFCSLLPGQTSTPEDGQFICLCITGQRHMAGKESRGNRSDSIFFPPPSHSAMFLSLPWEQECKTSALMTNKHLQATVRQ